MNGHHANAMAEHSAEPDREEASGRGAGSGDGGKKKVPATFMQLALAAEKVNRRGNRRKVGVSAQLLALSTVATT